MLCCCFQFRNACATGNVRRALTDCIMLLNYESLLTKDGR